jgi:hypothetical protein
MVQDRLGKKQDPISKLTRPKKTGGIVQVVGCLSSKLMPWVQTQVQPKNNNKWTILELDFNVVVKSIKDKHCRAPVAHTCEPSYWGGRDQEDGGLKPAQANGSQDPISKQAIIKTGWQSGSSGRVPVKWAWGPEFKMPVPPPKRKEPPCHWSICLETWGRIQTYFSRF